MFTIRSKKYFWCDSSPGWMAGWAILDTSPQAIDIWTTSDKRVCREKLKYLKRKHCTVRMRLYEVRDTKRLELFTFNKLKQNVQS